MKFKCTESTGHLELNKLVWSRRWPKHLNLKYTKIKSLKNEVTTAAWSYKVTLGNAFMGTYRRVQIYEKQVIIMALPPVGKDEYQ